jgi:hypothetical protein
MWPNWKTLNHLGAILTMAHEIFVSNIHVRKKIPKSIFKNKIALFLHIVQTSSQNVKIFW